MSFRLKSTVLMPIVAALMCLAAVLASALNANAQSVEEIKSKGKVVVGIMTDSPPWGLIDSNGKAAGYEADFAEMIAKELGVPVQYEHVLSANRIPMLLTGKIDLIVGQLGMYPERAKQIQYSRPYATLKLIVIGPKDSDAKDWAALEGKRVGTPRGSAEEVSLTKLAPPGVNVLRFDGDAATVQALISGQVDFITGTNIYFLNLEEFAPGRFEQKILVSQQYNGVGVRPGQKELLDLVNGVIERATADGQLNALSQKWLKQDLDKFPDSIEGISFTIP